MNWFYFFLLIALIFELYMCICQIHDYPSNTKTYIVSEPQHSCTNYTHIPPYKYPRKVLLVKTVTIEEKHQVYISNELPPVIIHHPDCKFCKYQLNNYLKEQKK